MFNKGLRLAREYREVLEPAKAKQLTALALATLAGALEGSALLILIPLVNSLAQGDATPHYALLAHVGLEGLSYKVQIGLALGVCLALALSFSVVFAKSQDLFAEIEFETVKRLLQDVTQATYLAPWEKYLTLGSGELEKAILLESHRIAFGGRQLLNAFAQTLVAILMLALCAVVSWKMTLVAILFAALGTLAYFRKGRGVQSETSQLTQREADLAAEMGQIFSNFKFFRIWDHAGRSEHSLRVQFDRYSSLHAGIQRAQNRIRMLAECSAIVALFAFLSGGLFVLALPAGVLLVLLAIFYRVVPRLLAINSLLIAAEVELRFVSGWRARIEHLRSTYSGVTNIIDSKALSLRHSLEARSITVTLENKVLVRKLSFVLPTGHLLAVVGSSGAGKSSLVDALCGLLPVSEGTLVTDGEPFDAVTSAKWREQVAVVLQSNPLLPGTLLSNIAWDDPEPNLERVAEIVQRTALHELVRSLPEGLTTKVGRGFRQLSGGEEQRVALARALYRQPALLILDEPTSALDAQSEDVVANLINSLKGTTTTIVVTHRLKLARSANRILVMEHARVIEEGTWDSLMRQGDGTLSRMALRQG